MLVVSLSQESETWQSWWHVITSFRCSSHLHRLCGVCFEVMMCGLCLFFGQDYTTVRKKKNSLQLNKDSVRAQDRISFGFFLFFSMSIMVQRLSLTKLSANKYWKIRLVSLLGLFFHSIPQFSEVQM